MLDIVINSRKAAICPGMEVQQIILPGEVNWMTAGKGIAHSECFEDPETLAGGSLEMIQTWVALPEKFEESDPTFHNYKPEELPVFTDTGVWMRLIAGDAFGLRNDVKTHSPLFYLHVILEPNGRFGLPQEHSERAIYIAKADWKEGRIQLLPNDNQEFIPLPEDKSKPAGEPAPEALS